MDFLLYSCSICQHLPSVMLSRIEFHGLAVVAMIHVMLFTQIFLLPRFLNMNLSQPVLTSYIKLLCAVLFIECVLFLVSGCCESNG